MIPMILLVLAFVLALLSALGIGAPKFNLLAGALAAYFLSLLLGGMGIKL